MSWSIRHDALIAEISRQFQILLPTLRHRQNACLELAALAVAVAREHGWQATAENGIWKTSPQGPIRHAWCEVTDGADVFLIHSRIRWPGKAAQIEVISPIDRSEFVA